MNYLSWLSFLNISNDASVLLCVHEFVTETNHKHTHTHKSHVIIYVDDVIFLGHKSTYRISEFYAMELMSYQYLTICVYYSNGRHGARHKSHHRQTNLSSDLAKFLTEKKRNRTSLAQRPRKKKIERKNSIFIYFSWPTSAFLIPFLLIF